MNPVFTDKPRVPLWVDADDLIVSQHLIQMGDWDNPLAQVLERALNPDDVFLDLGAHVGYFSLVAAQKCKRVIAVEPQKDLCDLIRMNGKDNIEVRQCAVGVEAGTQDLFVPVNRGAASFNHHDGEKESVAVVELKDVADGATVCKIDIEGDGSKVFRANPGFLESLGVIIFEYHPDADGVDCFEDVQKAGFTVYSIGDGWERPEPPELTEGFYTNLAGLRV